MVNDANTNLCVQNTNLCVQNTNLCVENANLRVENANLCVENEILNFGGNCTPYIHTFPHSYFPRTKYISTKWFSSICNYRIS